MLVGHNSEKLLSKFCEDRDRAVVDLPIHEAFREVNKTLL